MIIIRQETQADHACVYELVQKAFATAEHRDGTEQDLVERLRKTESFIPELSLVALNGDKIVGYILFTKIRLGMARAVGLAPLAIAPQAQRQGIGMRLMEAGHQIAKELGYEYSVVVGSERYYPRAGYRPASEFGILAPFEVPDQNFMALRLQGEMARFDNETMNYDDAFFET